MSGYASPTLKRVGGGRAENMYQEMVYYNRMHVKTRLSQSILSKIIGLRCDACIVWPWKGQKWFARSNCTYTREFDVIPATGASYWPIIAQCTQVRVKPDILKNSKQIFLLVVFKRNFVHESAWIQRVFYAYSRSANDEMFMRYSRSCRYEI
jgi:hypothetical protein